MSLSPELRLRHYDKALRLRPSQEDGSVLLLERKVFRGRIGCHAPDGKDWTPDAGRRREEGHVFVGTIPRDGLAINEILDDLKKADTWQDGVPLWQRVEDADNRVKTEKVQTRKDTIKHRTSEMWDSYCWRYKARVAVPVQLET